MLRRDVRQKTALFCADSGFLRRKWLIYISFCLLREIARWRPGRRQVRQSTASQQSLGDAGRGGRPGLCRAIRAVAASRAPR